MKKDFLPCLLILILVVVTLIVFDCLFIKREEPIKNVEEKIHVCNVTFSHFETYVPEEEKEPPKTEGENQPKFLGEFVLTAYCPCTKCCGIWGENRYVDEDGNVIVVGSTGKRLSEGRSIAVDPRVIPYGTEVIIDGQAYIAEDCGGSIKGNRIDVYFDDHESALKFGRQTKKVYYMEG